MEVSHSLTLNEAALQQLPDDKKPHFIFEWLRFLDKVLVAAHKSDLKSCQEKLVAQLLKLLRENLGAPARRLLARCLATLFSVGDPSLLFEAVNKCNDIIKIKDDSPSYLPTRLAAICCLGSMYEKLGRMMGRSYEETVTTLVRSMKNAESQTRLEIMTTLDKICVGMGTAAGAALREVSRAAKAALLNERATPVRAAAANTIRHMLPLLRLSPADVDAIAAACLRAAHPSDYALRCAVAELLGALIAATQAGEVSNINTKTKIGMQPVANKKDPPKNVISLEEALNLLMGAFLRGGTSFLKGEIIKSGSGVNREVRVCVTNAYVMFVQNMGGVWLERNMSTFLSHVLDLVANPKAASSHVDAVYSRKCINYILRNTLGKMLGEKAQASACREIIQIVAKQMNSIDFNPENAKDCNQETLFSQHLLVCALTEAGELAQQLGTSVHNLVADTSLNMVDTVCSVLEHPCIAARLGAASCLRGLCIAHPALLAPLLERCTDALDVPRPTPHRISGYSAALAAILGAVRSSPLGVPHGRGKIAFNAAEQLLRSAGQSSRLTAARTNAGWLIVGAICTLGVPVVRGLLPRMLLLWRNSFPRSAKELESEKARGDAFTWQVTLEGRAGALSALHSLLIHCPSLVNNEDTAKRLTQPIDGAIAVLTNVGTVVRNYGGSLKAPAALLRLRLYQACAALGAAASAPAAPLLRLLAAELAGSADTSGANVATGLLRSAMHPRDTILLGEEGWIYDTDHAQIEEQLISPLSASGSSALEHDPCCLYRKLSGAQPLGVAVIDASVALFPLIFSRAANKHRQQMLEHFVECIKMSKGTRQEAIQINVYTALLLALRTLAEQKSSLGTGQDAVKTAAVELVIAGLSANSATVRAAAASCAGRLCSCVTEAESQALSERVIALARSSTSRPIRAAAAAAVGAVQRARGAASSAAALPVLRALAQDTAAVEVQVWSLHALSVLVDASGPMFRGHVDSTLNLVLKLVFSSPPCTDDLHRGIGRLLAALITVVGPELQACGCAAVGRFICACAALREGGAAGAAADAIGGLQQLHMFAPNHINLHALVPQLCRDLSSSELSVRRAALCCLRQLSQKDAADVCKYAMLAAEHVPARPYCGVVITDTGLPGALFVFLDMERDETALSHARDALTCCLLAAAGNRSVRDWLVLAKKVLTVRLEDSNNTDTDFEAEGDDDQAEFHAETEQSTHPAIQPRWPTRVFAMECIQKVMGACEATGDNAHFDLVKAKEKLLTDPNADYLSLHLSDLVRMAFVGATGESDALRLCGLKTLQIIIQQYARAPEPDFPGHLLLEQYQAQVGAAVRPAFAGDTASHVTAAACDVCSAWIGCGVARDINDLRRVHQLLVSSLDKLNKKGNTTLIYNESMATLEKLSILKAWAEVYIVAMVSNDSAPGSYVKQLDTKPVNNRAEIAKWRNQVLQNNNQIDNANQESDDDEYGEFESKGESLLKLVEPELESLGENWLAALKDHALLSLPPEFASQLPHGGGAFYSAETAEASRAHYARAWPSLLYAAALRFNATIANSGQDTDQNTETSDNSVDNKNSKTENGNFEFFEPVDEKFHLLFGICMEALCAQRDMSVENTITVLLSLVTLLDAPENRARLLKDRALAIELCQIIHRTGLTQESVEALLLAADVLQPVVAAAREQLRRAMQDKIKELAPDEATESIPQSVLEVVHTLGEGGPTGDLPPGKSLVFACLEVCICLLVRRLPSLSPLKQEGRVGVIGVRKGLGVHGDTLLIKSLASMSDLTTLTSPQGALSLLPTILYLATEILRESKGDPTLSDAGILLLQQAAECKAVRVHPDTSEQHALLLQSTLATLVDRVKSEEPDQRIDNVTGARAMAAVLARAAPAPPLHYPCINHFRQCLDTRDHEVFASCCTVLRSVWSRTAPAECVSWWARALAARVVARAAAARHATDAAHVKAAIAAVTALDELVDAAPDTARIQMLWILVPIVISYLREAGELARAPAQVRTLHEFALHWLMRVGPKHPQEFKTMMQQSSELRTKLENAVKANQANRNVRRPPAARPAFDTRPAKPTIELKTDFSDFR